MQRILILATLTLCLVGLSAPHAAAQAQRPEDAAQTAAKTATGPQSKLFKMPVPTILGITGGVSNIDASNGGSTYIATPKYVNGMSMQFAGFAQAGNTLYGLTILAPVDPMYRSSIFTIGPDANSKYGTLSGWAPLTLNGNRMYCMGEGDLAYDRTGKSGGVLYATCLDGVWKLITIAPGNGAVTVKGVLPAGGIYSALAFNPAGNPTGDLYTLDTQTRTLYKLDKNTAAVLATIPLTGTLPNTSAQGAMGFSDDGVLYAGIGGAFVTINTTTGAVNTIRPTNYGYISGLSVTGTTGLTKFTYTKKF